MTDPLPRLKRRGLMFVLSSPSGAGKTTISRRLLDSDDNLWMSVSVTTRPRRPGEVAGRDYEFVDQKTFDTMVEEGALLEHARVFSHCYGSPRAPIEAALTDGCDILFDIDWQGAQQVAEAMRGDVVKVFILPPSKQALETRLKGRAQDPPDVVAARMAKAGEEITHWAEYDYVCVNDDLDVATAGVRAVLEAERLRRQRQLNLNEFVDGLIRGAQ